MPVSLIQATAEEAADNFRQEIGAVLSGLASALGTPYPSTIVTDEADARKYVPGSIFLLKDGTYAWSALSSAVRKEATNPRPAASRRHRQRWQGNIGGGPRISRATARHLPLAKYPVVRGTRRKITGVRAFHPTLRYKLCGSQLRSR